MLFQAFAQCMLVCICADFTERMCAQLYSYLCMCAIYNVCLCLISTHLFVTYQCAILYRHDWSCACSSVDLETEPCCHQGGNGQSMAHGKVHNALWIVALRQGDVSETGGLINGSSSTHLINLHQEPRLVLRFLRQHRWVIVSFSAPQHFLQIHKISFLPNT